MRAKPAIPGLDAPLGGAAKSSSSLPLRRCVPHGFRAMALGLSLAAASPLLCTAQTFIRVTPPSADQQDQGTVNAMPNPNAGAPGAVQEAVLTGNQHAVKIVDANGNEVKKDKWGLNSWRPTFTLNVGFTYDDNIFIQRDKTSDYITSIEPGIVVGWGDYRAELPRLGQFTHEYEIPIDDLTAQRYIYLTYHPKIQLFAENTGQDAVDENLTLAGSYQFTKLVLQGSFQYQTLSDADIDVGDRVDRSLYTGVVSGVYPIDDKTSIEVKLLSYSTEYDRYYESSVDTSDTNFVNYQLAPKTSLSAGVNLGYLIPELSANQLYQQLLGRVRWAASDKFYANVTAGVEFREVNSGTDKVNAVFDGSLNYAPLDGTRLLLGATRAAQPASDELGQDIVLTSVQLGVQQRLIGRVYASVAGTYSNADYEHVSTGSSISRSDDTFTVNVSLGADLTQYAGIQLATPVR